MFSNIRKLTAAAMLGAAAVAVSGCAATLPTKVTRYQALPAAQGQSFYVVPGTGLAQSGGLEFQRYAGLVAQQMAARGYRPAASPQAADFIVQLGYSVDEGREVVTEDPFYRSRLNDPFYRGYGGYGSRYGGFGYGGFGFDPYWGVYRGRPYFSRFGYYGYRSPYYYGWDDPYWYGGRGIREYTEYRSELELDIRDRRTNQPLFDGRAQARSQTDELGTLVPNLVEAMFTGFPGRSGETVKITVPAKRRG
jgi:hypothetical protein